MKKSVNVILASLVLMGFLLVPVICSADAGGNGNGNGYGIGNGNAYGQDNGNGNGNGYTSVQQVPEPLTLFLLGSGLVGLAVIKRKIK